MAAFSNFAALFSLDRTPEAFEYVERALARALAEPVSRMRRAILDTGSSDYLRISRTLYDRLTAPIRSHLDGPNLLIIPHGVLHYLPFNALVSDGQYLIDQYSIRMLPSSSVLMFLKARGDRRDSLMALGNPDLGICQAGSQVCAGRGPQHCCVSSQRDRAFAGRCHGDGREGVLWPF